MRMNALPRPPEPRRRPDRAALITAAVLVMASPLLPSCAGKAPARTSAPMAADEGEKPLTATDLVVPPAVGSPPEEIPRSFNEVPAFIHAEARRLTGAIGGGARCASWMWDTEDNCWECAVTGLRRQAELDITESGLFDELEFMVTLDELRHVAPAVSVLIDTTCGDSGPMTIEISIRDERYLTPDPDLAFLWHREGIFFEVQCNNAHDFEVDPYGDLVTHPDDDMSSSL